MEVRLARWEGARAVALRRVRVAYQQLVVEFAGDERRVLAECGTLRLEDADGHVEEHGLRPSDLLCVEDGATARVGSTLYVRGGTTGVIAAHIPIDEEATVEFFDLVEGVTSAERLDWNTGYTRVEVIEGYLPGLCPRIVLRPVSLDAPWAAVEVKLCRGAVIQKHYGERVRRGDVLAVIRPDRPAWQHEGSGVASGLALLCDHLEGRRPHAPKAVIAPVSGRIRRINPYRGRLWIDGRDGEVAVRIPRRGFSPLVAEGVWVYAGDRLTHGVIDHRDLARVLDPEDFAEHLVREIQTIYALHGVVIRDAQVELVVRRLISRVEITETGDSGFLRGEVVTRDEAQARNAGLVAAGKAPARYVTSLTGLSKLVRGR
jgi:hypothetical protein